MAGIPQTISRPSVPEEGSHLGQDLAGGVLLDEYCINISARVDDKPDMLCPWEKLYGRRPTSLVLPFMMPGFRHANRKTKMHSKGERCFYPNTGHDHSFTAHKVLLASGVASYTADVTLGYHRRPFVGESPTWGDGAVVSSPPSPQQP